MRVLIGLLIQNPEFALLVPPINSLRQAKRAGIELFVEIVNVCLSQPNLTTGQLLEIYRNTKNAHIIEKLSIWGNISDKKIAERMFTDSMNHLFDSLLDDRLSELIARSRVYGLTLAERREVKVITEARSRR